MPHAPLRILVTGASVAGPAAAFWLARTGHDVTVVERAPSVRDGGQNIDVRASGREVLRLMDLEEAALARNTGEVGTRFVDEEGRVVAEFPVDDTDGSDGPTAEMEILRGALSRLLVDACPESVDWRFGTSVAGLEQDADGVTVELDGGPTERFDLVVVAEGVGSTTRDLVLGDRVEERPLGMDIVYGTIPRTAADDDWWSFLSTAGSRQVSLRPDDVGTTRAMLTLLTDEPVLTGLDPTELRTVLHERFSDLGWEVPRVLDGLDDSDDLYAEHLRQVVLPTWHEGRVCLLGDAAWCVTPIGGGGTSLAITGAYVLAAYLSEVAPGDHVDAFERYETWMRPLVEDAQELPPGTPRIAAPRTRAGVAALRLGLRVAALPPVRAIATRLTSGPASEEDLPPIRATLGP